MRHRIKAGKVGSFTPEKQKMEVEQLEDREVAEDVEEIFEEDSNFSNDDEALAAMEFYDSPDAIEQIKEQMSTYKETAKMRQVKRLVFIYCCPIKIGID